MSVAWLAVEEPTVEHSVYSFPFLMVLAYIFVDFGRPQDWVPPLRSLRPGMIVLGGGILALLLWRTSSIPKLGKYVLAFLVVMAIGVPFAVNNRMAFNETTNMALFLFGAVLPIMLFVDSYRKITVLFRFWVGIHVPLALYSIQHGGYGVGSFLGDQNDFCLAINMVIPYAFFLLFVARSKLERLLLIGSIIIFLLAIVGTNSRGGFLGLLAVGLSCWLFTPRKVVTTVIILLLCGAFLLAAPPSYWQEMNTIKTSNQEGDTGEQRLYLWGIAWKLFLDDPIWGVGPTNFQYAGDRYESEEKKASGLHIWGKVSHSLYLTLLSEEGLVGAIVFLMIMQTAWKDRRTIRGYYRYHIHSLSGEEEVKLKTLYYLSLAIDISLIGFLVTGAFLTVLYYPHFWLLTAYSTVLKNEFDRTVQDSETQAVRTGQLSVQAAQTA